MKETLRSSKGFTLVELSVVIVIIGVLAAFGVPRFRNAVEKSKAGEAFNYLAAIRSAQERYHSRAGTYAATPQELDISLSTNKYFTVGAIDATDLETGWKLTLTRTGPSAGYGNYTVTFTEDGYDATGPAPVIPDAINPMAT